MSSARSPWQVHVPAPVSFDISGLNSNHSSSSHRQTQYTSSASSNGSIFGASAFNNRAEHVPDRDSIPTTKILPPRTPSSMSFIKSRVNAAEVLQSRLLEKQRQRSILTPLNKHNGRDPETSHSFLNMSRAESEVQAIKRDEGIQVIGENGGRESASSSPVVIDDDDDVVEVIEVKSSPTAPLADKEKSSDVVQSAQRSGKSFLNCKYTNDKKMEETNRSRAERQAIRKRQIEEEEMKARAYEEKRRAQEKSLERQLKYQMRIFDSEPQVNEEIFVEEESDEEDVLPELTDEIEDVVRSALRPGNPGEVLSDSFRLQITRRDMATLAGLNWLNDEVINFYMNMLMERGEQEGRDKVYAFNTFFYPKIMSGGHSAVKRWTKKVDIFAMRYIVIPVHLGMHWCLCMADMQDKVITYYDSMGATNNKCLQAVLNYINDESIVKKQTAIKKSEWTLINAEDNPQQMNGSDCGMFMCKYAEYITRGKDITFTQEDMPYFRRRMVYEIISKKLLQ